MTFACSDNGVSADIPQCGRAGGHGGPTDRLIAIEGKLAKLEARPGHSRNDSRDSNRGQNKAMFRGRVVCWDFNNWNGCKRPPIPGGCKNGKSEYAHVCNLWVKSKNAHCLLPHPRKDHK